LGAKARASLRVEVESAEDRLVVPLTTEALLILMLTVAV
jgi:hypothetical protein